MFSSHELRDEIDEEDEVVPGKKVYYCIVGYCQK